MHLRPAEAPRVSRTTKSRLPSYTRHPRMAQSPCDAPPCSLPAGRNSLPFPLYPHGRGYCLPVLRTSAIYATPPPCRYVTGPRMVRRRCGPFRGSAFGALGVITAESPRTVADEPKCPTGARLFCAMGRGDRCDLPSVAPLARNAPTARRKNLVGFLTNAGS